MCMQSGSVIETEGDGEKLEFNATFDTNFDSISIRFKFEQLRNDIKLFSMIKFALSLSSSTRRIR